MQLFSSEKIRNVALVGHGGAGKTTLAEALLHRAGAINRLGRVEDGTTVCDHEPEEQTRGLSLSLAAGPVRVEGPQGQPDRHARATPTSSATCVAALRVVDLAVFVVSRGRRRRGADRGHLARGRPARRAPHDLRQQARPGAGQLRAHPRPAPRPARRRRRAARAAHRRGGRASGASPTCSPTPPTSTTAASRTPSPSPTTWRRSSTRCTTTSSRASSSPTTTLLERYLEGDMPVGRASSSTRSRSASRRRSVFPVVCGSATTEVGIDRLADFLVEIGPPPADRPTIVTAGDTEVEVAADPDGEPLAFVFKTIADPFVGQVTLFKVLSGTIRNDDHLVNSRTGTDERLHGLFVVRGKEHEPVDALGGRRHRRRGQAVRHASPATRSPRRASPCTSRPIEHPAAGARRRGRAEDAGRRRQARPPRSTACQDEDPALARRARRGDAPDPALGHRRDPPRRSPSSGSSGSSA